MSALIHLSNEILSAHQPGVILAAEGDGILDWTTSKNVETQTLLRALAVTLGIIFVIIQAVASRGAMARIIISLLAAGVFIWGVWSITDIQDLVENEMSSGPVLPGASLLTDLGATGSTVALSSIA